MLEGTTSLQLDFFKDHVACNLSNIFPDSSFAEVTLVSDDQIQFQAHKFVISASSSVFKNLLLDNPDSHPLIYLKGVQQQELGSILQFMYLGEVNMLENCSSIFLNNAKDLLDTSFVTGNNFAYLENNPSDKENDSEYDVIGNFDISENDTKSISNTIDEILALNIPTYNTNMDGTDNIQWINPKGIY